MPNSRVRGQETEITLIVDGQPRLNITFVKSHSFIYKFKKSDAGYIGETTQRYDTVFMGIDGKFQINMGDPDIFRFAEQLKAKARLRTPGMRVNVKTVVNFPNGRRARVLIEDVEFGDLPFDFADRSEKATVDLEYSASDGKSLIS